MDGYDALFLIIIVIAIIVITIISIVLLVSWIIKSWANKKYYLAVILLLIMIPSLSWYTHKHTRVSVIKDFEEASEVKVPRYYRIIKEDDSFLLIVDQMVDIKMQLDSASTNKLILDIKKTKNYLPDNYLNIDYYRIAMEEGKIKENSNWIQSGKGYYLFSTKNKNGYFLVGLDSIRRTLSIQKNWSVFD
jgi:hypothetical protein